VLSCCDALCSYLIRTQLHFISLVYILNLTIGMSLRTRGGSYKNFTVTFPRPKVVQVTLDRPEKLNCIDNPTSKEIAKIWEQFDEDETLWVGIITGNGRAFCTGADLAGKSRLVVDLGQD
jgi:1,4-dihydroxy-2-naphthoyl-CoA synthase